MNKKLKKFIQYIILLAIGILLIYLSFRKTNISPKDLLITFQNTNILWISLSLLITFFSHIVRAYRWNYLLENYNYKTDLFTASASVFIGYLANYGLPRMGEVSRCAIVSKYNKIPFDTALGTVLAERIIDLLLMFIVFLFILFFQYQDIQTLLNTYILHPISQKFSTQQLLISSILFTLVVILLWIINKKLRPNKSSASFFTKILFVIKNLTQPMLNIHKIKRPFAFWLWSIGIWILYFLSMYTCSLALDETKHLGVMKMMILFLFGTIGVIVTPGGIGSYHFLITELLLFYNIQNAPAVTFPWLIWGTQFILILFLGGLSFILLPIIHNKKEANEPIS